MATAHHAEHPTGFTRWLYTTNHKDIGTLYLVFAFIMAIVGGIMSLVIRSELWQPGLQLVDPHFFNQMTTVHALVMIFGFVMPAFTGLANWQIPMMIGAPLATQGGAGMDFTILSIHLLGMSSILGSINIIVTVLNMRAPGMTLMK